MLQSHQFWLKCLFQLGNIFFFNFSVKAAKALKVFVGKTQVETKMLKKASYFCYITQDIELPAFLTVKETMAFATRLKMPVMPPGITVEKFVKSIVGPLGLESSLDTYVNNLSGGQRKRLAIATELINYPPVLFADEPTSGLDSAMAEECIDLFKEMSRKGCNIITTIHQPSAKVFSIFDTLYCISRGECIYEGRTRDVIGFLNNIHLTPPPFYSPADFMLDIALGEQSEAKLRELIDRTREVQLSLNPNDDDTDDKLKQRSKELVLKEKSNEIIPKTSSNASFWSQTYALSERVLKTTFRNHVSIFVTL